MLRLDALLSRFGYCSRGEARAWIREGRVLIRGQLAASASQKVGVDDVRIDGEPVEHPDGILALLHKPAGYVCSHDSTEGPTVYDLLPARWLRRNPSVTTIGRLDKDATGALLITDRGDLVHRWTSPKHKVPKLYEVAVADDFPADIVATFQSGRLLLEGEDKPCLPARVVIINSRQAELEIVEGRYHQVKRMFAAVGCPVLRLHRSKFGEHTVDSLQPGEWRVLTLREH